MTKMHAESRIWCAMHVCHGVSPICAPIYIM